MKCHICKKPACLTESFRGYYFDAIVDALPGQCIRCKKYFCKEHSTEFFYDDDLGFFSITLCCHSCEKISREKRRKKLHKKYIWYKKNIPIVGGLIYWCMTA